jgi:hypothetical protein
MTDFKSEYDFYKLKKWATLDRIHWWRLVDKKHAITFIEKNLDYFPKNLQFLELMIGC